MIDPARITDFGRSLAQLEELVLFAILVAGKRSQVVARDLARFLASVPGDARPFAKVAQLVEAGQLRERLAACGLGGQINRMVRALGEAARLDLSEGVAVDQLEAVYGVGPKSARFVVLHSQPAAVFAVLDRHVLRFLKAAGYKVPASLKTPSNRTAYRRLEAAFLAEAARRGQSPAELDLAVWKSYAQLGKAS